MFAFCPRDGRAGCLKENEQKEDKMNRIPPPPSPDPDQVKSAAVTFDWADWLPYLDEVDATPAQKQALIESLWSIILTFVDLGFEVTPPPETSGKLPDLKGDLALAMVNLEDKEGLNETS